MSGSSLGTPESRQQARDAAEKRGLDADRAAADADQTAADREQSIMDEVQAASDADRLSSEQDEADSESDQRASDQDEAQLDRTREDAPDPATQQDREASRLAREATTRSRRVTRDARAETARLRETAMGTESSSAGPSERVQSQASEGRSRAADDRRRSAGDRSDAAETRAGLEAELDAARLDSLTGALRRDLGTLMLTNEIDRARRGNGRFTLAFIDIDDMKGLNDREGHAAGDQALRSLASIMRANLRSFDPVVRYGGDEFVCGISGVGIADVERRFRVIDAALRHELRVGISFGLAVLEGKESLDELTARADANLLEAKRGRSPAVGRDGNDRVGPVEG
jgi:diguanylate cyclase (GGDEF)-like protein